MMDRAELIAAFSKILEDVDRVHAGKDNREPMAAHGEIAGAMAALMRASGVSRSFDAVFMDEGGVAQTGDQGLYRGLGAVLTRYGAGFMPAGVAATLGADAYLTSEKQWSPRTAALLRDISTTLGSDGGFIALLSCTIGAAVYADKAGLVPKRGWVAWHREILPSDANERPDDSTRRKWRRDRVPLDAVEAYAAAGEARAAGLPLTPEMAENEALALTWLQRPPEQIRAVYDEIMGAMPKDIRTPKKRRF